MLQLSKFTKIVATIGPATEDEETIQKLIEAGMNVARFNTKHSNPAWHQERIARVRKVAKRMGVSVATLLDLQGPEIRINLPDEKPFELQDGETVTFTADEKVAADKKVIIPTNVVDTLQVGNLVLLDDGFCEFEVVETHSNRLILKSLGKCTVKHRKTMNIPGITIDMPALVPADYDQLDGVTKESLVDFVGLSFVRNKNDIEFLRQELKKRNIAAKIVAKIETQAALDNLEEVITASDAVMVARGDLGVEVPYQELVFWQRKIINICRVQGKPVIVATQMLKSMVEYPRPTRAEVSDVAHAIYDGTDAVMLSEETTIGDYPVKAVKTQATIAAFNEKFVDHAIALEENDDKTEIITRSAVIIANHKHLGVDAIVCLTRSGRTAYLISRLRPSIPIIAITPDLDTWHYLSLSYGVTPLFTKQPIKPNSHDTVAFLEKNGVVQSGERLLVVHGIHVDSGYTNALAIITVD